MLQRANEYDKENTKPINNVKKPILNSVEKFRKKSLSNRRSIGILNTNNIGLDLSPKQKKRSKSKRVSFGVLDIRVFDKKNNAQTIDLTSVKLDDNMDSNSPNKSSDISTNTSINVTNTNPSNENLPELNFPENDMQQDVVANFFNNKSKQTEQVVTENEQEEQGDMEMTANYSQVKQAISQSPWNDNTANVSMEITNNYSQVKKMLANPPSPWDGKYKSIVH